jgi:hypothetical protein
LLKELKQRARYLKSETFALYLAARDPRTPWYAKLVVAGIVAYAFSPIDQSRILCRFLAIWTTSSYYQRVSPWLQGWFPIKF